MKSRILKLYWIFAAQFGIDFIKLFRAIINVPYFLKTLFIFKSVSKTKITISPCLNDRKDFCGTAHGEYFWQDLFVAKLIYTKSPKRHIDIGSRFDGFISTVSCFREIEVIDIRPIEVQIPNISFHRMDIMNEYSIEKFLIKNGCCDSLSCLHSIEHFGLGRYGDPIHPHGYVSGLRNMSSLIKNGGMMYLSTPVGVERVEFNANWVFNPRTIIDSALSVNLRIHELFIFDEKVGFRRILNNDETLLSLSKEKYNLLIFIFIKQIDI